MLDVVCMCALAFASSLTQQRLSDLQTVQILYFLLPSSNGKLCEIGNENQIKHAKSSQMLRAKGRSTRLDSTMTTTTTTTTTQNKKIEATNKKPQNNWLTLTSLYDFGFVWNVLTLDNTHKNLSPQPKTNKQKKQMVISPSHFIFTEFFYVVTFFSSCQIPWLMLVDR